MRSFAWMMVGLGAGVGASRGETPKPMVTPAPSAEVVEAVKRDGPDAVSLADVLLTAVPESLREIAATNIPAVSSILWSEFLDNNKPSWFLALPADIQSYLIAEFGPATAIASATRSGSAPGSTAVRSSVAGSSVAGSSGPASTAGYSTAESTMGPSSAATASVPASSGDASVSGETSRAATTSSAQTTHTSHETTLMTSVVTISMGSIGIPIANPTPTGSSFTSPTSDPSGSSGAGLSHQQKVAIGVGVPLAILGAAGLGLGCCFLLRRRRRNSVDGSIPPSSPGFIPRFAFQEKNQDSMDYLHPLNRPTHDFGDLNHMGWDNDVVDSPPQNAMINNPRPIMAPALFHTHSSNRARGKRTSYQSLHSVAEVTEPSENGEVESLTPSPTSPQTRSLAHPPIPEGAQVKRKPVGAGVTRKPVPNSYSPTHYGGTGQSPAAELASQSLLQQTMGTHNTGGYGTHTNTTAPLAEEHNPLNPFSNDYSYVEDYGPEYRNGDDVEAGLFGGYQSLSRYPEPKRSSPKSGKTEWPLRNYSRPRRERSPMWDRVYDSR